MNLLQGLLVSGGESIWLITCYNHHIALFSLYEFFPLGFSYKVFNEAISTQGYVISSIFFTWVFGGWYWDIRCIVLFSLCEFSIYGFSYKVFDEAMFNTKMYAISSTFSHWNFWKMIFEAYWPYGQGVFRLRLWVYLKGYNNISDCTSWCFSLFFSTRF